MGNTHGTRRGRGPPAITQSPTLEGEEMEDIVTRPRAKSLQKQQSVRHSATESTADEEERYRMKKIRAEVGRYLLPMS